MDGRVLRMDGRVLRMDGVGVRAAGKVAAAGEVAEIPLPMGPKLLFTGDAVAEAPPPLGAPWTWVFGPESEGRDATLDSPRDGAGERDSEREESGESGDGGMNVAAVVDSGEGGMHAADAPTFMNSDGGTGTPPAANPNRGEEATRGQGRENDEKGVYGELYAFGAAGAEEGPADKLLNPGAPEGPKAGAEGPADGRGAPHPMHTMFRMKLWAAQVRLAHLREGTVSRCMYAHETAET